MAILAPYGGEFKVAVGCGERTGGWRAGVTALASIWEGVFRERSCGAVRRGTRGEAEAIQNRPGDGRVVDEGEDAHLGAAAGAGEDIDREDALHEFGPGEPMGAGG